MAEWIQIFVVFLLLATILTMIVPSGNLQKYVKLTIRLLLLSFLLDPILSLFHVNLSNVFTNLMKETNMTTEQLETYVAAEKKEIAQEEQTYILKQATQQPESQVASELEEKYDKEIVQMDVTMEGEEITSEAIKEVIVTVDKADGGVIEPVKITIGSLQGEKTKDLQQFFATAWDIPQEKITVLSKGGR